MPRWGKRVLGPELASWERRKPNYLKETKKNQQSIFFQNVHLQLKAKYAVYFINDVG